MISRMLTYFGSRISGWNTMQKCLGNLKAGYIFLILPIFFKIFVSITKRIVTDSVTVDPNRTHYSYFSLLNGILPHGRYREVGN